jgi:putative redox protein
MTSVHCTTEHPNGSLHRLQVRSHVFYTDLPVGDGGEDAGPNAHDYFDASLAACRALTAVWFARRNAIPLERVESHVDRDNSEERKGLYRLIVRLVFHGPLTDEHRTRLHAAVARCPVSKLMTTSEVVIETVG